MPSALAYLNYFIYRFYSSKDPDPFIYAMNGSALLITMNLIVLRSISEFIFHINLSHSYTVIILVFLACFNYYKLYRNEKHEDIFFEIEKNDTKGKRIWCLIYIVLSFVICLSAILMIRYDKFGTL